MQCLEPGSDRSTLERAALSAAAIVASAAVALLAAACQTPSQPVEYFRFTYKIAHKQPDGRYRVPVRAPDGSCSGSVDLPQGQIILDIGRQHANLFDCVLAYTVPVQNNRAQGFNVVARINGDPAALQSNIDVQAERAVVIGTTTEPTNMSLLGNGPVMPGLLAGFADNYFGTTGPIFTSDRGSESFFEHQLLTLDLNARRVAGTFRFLASNKNDPNDNRLLIVVDSGYLMNLE